MVKSPDRERERRGKKERRIDKSEEVVEMEDAFIAGVVKYILRIIRNS
jgi:hypothetical protein